jgi:hypothetical protein
MSKQRNDFYDRVITILMTTLLGNYINGDPELHLYCVPQTNMEYRLSYGYAYGQEFCLR